MVRALGFGLLVDEFRLALSRLPDGDEVALVLEVDKSRARRLGEILLTVRLARAAVDRLEPSSHMLKLGDDWDVIDNVLRRMIDNMPEYATIASLWQMIGICYVLAEGKAIDRKSLPLLDIFLELCSESTRTATPR